MSAEMKNTGDGFCETAPVFVSNFLTQKCLFVHSFVNTSEKRLVYNSRIIQMHPKPEPLGVSGAPRHILPPRHQLAARNEPTGWRLANTALVQAKYPD